MDGRKDSESMSVRSGYRFTTRPAIVALDYETALTDGTPSTKFYRQDFRVVSAAFSWPINDGSETLESIFLQGEADVGAMLRQLAEMKVPLVVHNMQFELGCTLCRFPGLEFTWFDTMRMVQVYDNGGSDFDDTVWNESELEMRLLDMLEGGGTKKKIKRTPITGLGLANAIKRILPKEFHDHKKEAYDWLEANHGIKKNKAGANLHLLPLDLLERYNIGDSENTYRLYSRIKNHFIHINYNWEADHNLYRSSVYRLVESERRGIFVDRDKLTAHRDSVANEIKQIGDEFRTRFAEQIQSVESDLVEKEISKLKTEKGKAKRREKYASAPIVFNVGSNKQLGHLFVEKLGMVPTFKTEKGSPSFKSSFLGQWGDGGKILLKRRKRLLVQKQCDSLLAMSEYDGRWHCSLKACGTKTGRYAGGSI